MSVIMSVGTMAVVSTMALGVVTAGGAAVTAQRLSAAADAAALAAADSALGFAPGVPCDNAARIAAAHGAVLAECTVDETTVRVSVNDTFAGFPIAAAARAGAPAGSLGMNAAGWVRPSDGEITSPYGEREAQCDASGCASTMHEGVDFAAGCGAPIYAARSGTIASAGDAGGYGNQVRIDHGDGLVTGYAHIQNNGILVNSGDVVTSGQLIALEGDTGRAFGCHVHVTLEQNGALIDPMSVLG
ncbi:Rv3654c family TadE-like protein [Microbacterium sp. YY-03]|uniref:Rv3654c family TadE-like protein n=1 Tax=Microbacterium sp. YY-03 TaxID=3421636 RepID=UPI003D17A5B7